MRIYGLKVCDTCRKARTALEAAGHDVAFRDVREEPLDAALIARFLGAFGERLVNRASTTWRGLDEAERDAPPAVLLARYPTLMKRPVIEVGARLFLGWSAAVQAEVLK